MIRLIDLVFSLIFMPIYLTLIVLGSVLKLIIDGRPIFYTSERLVKNLEVVKIYKFRTMINDRFIISSEVEKFTRNGFESIPLESKIYTPLGRIYEKYQLVELPQFFNILKGNLSLVGYRPLPEKNIKKLINDLGPELIHERHKYVPGLTGYSQLIGKINLSPSKRLSLEIKLNRDLYESGLLKSVAIYFSLIIDTVVIILFDQTIFLDRKKLIE